MRLSRLAYLITPEVFAHLDHREKNGYLRVATPIRFDGDDDGEEVIGLIYIAAPDNAAFLGPAAERDIARHIARSAGPSGPNSDYLNQLAAALRALGRHDQHVFDIERHMAELQPSSAHPTPLADGTLYGARYRTHAGRGAPVRAAPPPAG